MKKIIHSFLLAFLIIFMFARPVRAAVKCGHLYPTARECPIECVDSGFRSGLNYGVPYFGFYCYDNVENPNILCPTSSGGEGITTALGCIPMNTIALAAGSNAFLLGAAGFIGLLLIAKAGFEYMTSQGDPSKLSNAQQTITAVVAGLVMLSISIYFYRLIAVNILGLF